MNAEAIRKRIQSFDHSDDKYWTDDGYPRLDMIGPSVTRAQVVAAAPGFTRQTPEGSSAPDAVTSAEKPTAEPSPKRFADPVPREKVLSDSERYHMEYRAWSDQQAKNAGLRIARQQKLNELKKEAGFAVEPRKSPLDAALGMRSAPKRPTFAPVGQKAGR